MTVLKMNDVDLTNKRVLIREDFNVPIANGKITSDARIQAALPTINLALKNGRRSFHWSLSQNVYLNCYISLLSLLKIG